MFKRKSYIADDESWSTILASYPFSIPITELLARTPITPNQVTILSFLISLAGVYLFYIGELFWGAIIWQLGFIFDCVDGSLARKKNMASDFGAKLDHTLDRIKKFFAIIAIVYATHSQYNLKIMVSLLFLHYLLHQIRFKQNEGIIKALHSKGIKSLFDPLEEQFFIIFLGPITGRVFEFVVITVVLQLLNRIVHIYSNYISKSGLLHKDL